MGSLYVLLKPRLLLVSFTTAVPVGSVTLALVWLTGNTLVPVVTLLELDSFANIGVGLRLDIQAVVLVALPLPNVRERVVPVAFCSSP